MVSMDSILLIDKRGRIRRLFCPFQVKSIVELPEISLGKMVIVERLAITTDLNDVYYIRGKPYYSIHFIVILE